MNLVSRTLTGVALLLAGVGLIVASFFTTLFLLIYGVPLLIIGLFVLFNKKEDEIEEIKGIKSSKEVKK